jgi:hypothetical protein
MTQQYTQLFCLQIASKILLYCSGGGEGSPWRWNLEKEEESDVQEKPKKQNLVTSRKTRIHAITSENNEMSDPSEDPSVISILKLNKRHHHESQNSIKKIPQRGDDRMRRKEEVRNRIKRYQQQLGRDGEEEERKKEEDSEDDDSSPPMPRHASASGGYYLGKGESIQIEV